MRHICPIAVTGILLLGASVARLPANDAEEAAHAEEARLDELAAAAHTDAKARRQAREVVTNLLRNLLRANPGSNEDRHVEGHRVGLRFEYKPERLA